MLRRHFNLRAMGALLGGVWATQASRAQQVITSRGDGMEGEIISNDPHRRRLQKNADMPPGTLPAATMPNMACDEAAVGSRCWVPSYKASAPMCD